MTNSVEKLEKYQEIGEKLIEIREKLFDDIDKIESYEKVINLYGTDIIIKLFGLNLITQGIEVLYFSHQDIKILNRYLFDHSLLMIFNSYASAELFKDFTKPVLDSLLRIWAE